MTQIATFPFARDVDDVVRIRTATIDGEPWFVATDAARAMSLSLENGGVTRYLGRLAEAERRVVRRADAATLDLFEGAHLQALTLISESGLYKLIMRSDKPEAVSFQHWIASEVLPSIRKTGSYVLANHGREAMPLPMDLAEAMVRAIGQMAETHAMLVQLLARQAEPVPAAVPERFFRAWAVKRRYGLSATSAKIGVALKGYCDFHGIVTRSEPSKNKAFDQVLSYPETAVVGLYGPAPVA